MSGLPVAEPRCPTPGAATDVNCRMTLDKADLKMALAAVSYYRRALEISKVPEPPAAARLADRLRGALAANGQEDTVRQVNWLTTRDVMRRCNCSESTARRIAKRFGKKVGRQWLVSADALPE